MGPVRDRLRADLRVALLDRDRDTVRALRTVLAAIENAEAQPLSTHTAAETMTSARVAGTTQGVGSAEVVRREVDDAEVRRIVRSEIDELEAQAMVLDKHNESEAAEQMRSEAALLERYVS